MKKIILNAGIGLAALLLITEICLRVFLGLGFPPLVYASTQFGYAFRPNQSSKRFGHRVSYNEVGLRSEALRPLTGAAFRVLCIGGSVTNGGAPTSQEDTYPYQLEPILREKGQSAHVLNASAGGWVLENEYGFLQDKGIFDARFVVVEVGTRALYQKPALSSAAGTDPNLPDQKPWTATGELWSRYVLPRVLRKIAHSSSDTRVIWSPDSIAEGDYERGFGTLKEVLSSVVRSGAKPIVLLVPDREESLQGHYWADHRKDLSDLAANANGSMVDLLPVWQAQLSEGRGIFRDRDNINPSPLGYRLIAEAVAAAPVW